MNELNISVPKETAGKSLRFESAKDLRAWLDQELAAYQWLSKVSVRFGPQLWSHITTQFSGLRNQLDSLEQNVSRNQPFDGNAKSIQSWFTSTYKTKNLVLTSAPEFKAVVDLAEVSPVKAASFLAHLIRFPHLYKNGLESPEMLEGAFEYFQYSKALSKKDLSAERQALRDLQSEWDQALATYHAQSDSVKSTFNATSSNFDQFYERSKQSFDAFLKSNSDELNELKRTYDQYMALSAPVDYWNKKRKHHADRSGSLKKWSLWVGSLGGIGLGALIYLLFTDEKIYYWKVAILILLATLFFWVLRVLVKLLLANIHLEGDADERVVMNQTYLALLREQSGLSENDKKLILVTLFRPSNSGLAGEDGIPPGIYDLVTRLLGK